MLESLTYSTLGVLGTLGWPELLVLALLGVLIFGKRLPEVGKSIGRGIVEFKKGLSGIEDGLNDDTTAPRQSPQIEQHQRDATDTRTNQASQTTPEAPGTPGTPGSSASHGPA